VDFKIPEKNIRWAGFGETEKPIFWINSIKKP
jgi:hypothetical protein